MSSETISWPVLPFKWRRGYDIHILDVPRVYLSNDPVKNYEVRLSDLELMFPKYADAGDALLHGDRTKLEMFMELYGAPIHTDAEANQEMIFEKQLSPFEQTYMPIWDYLQIVESDAIHAAYCRRLLNAASRGHHKKIIEMAKITPLEAQNGCSISFLPNGVYALHVSNSAANIKASKWVQHAFDFLRVAVQEYVPALSVKLERTEDGYVLAHTIPSLRIGLWLAFMQQLPDLQKSDKETKRSCLKDEHHRGCGKDFYTTNPRDRLCPDCKRRINTERQRRKRAKA